MLSQITPVILTFNEQANLDRTLAALDWASEVLVIDSGSSDGTLEICQKYATVRVVHRAFDNFARQCNFALAQDIKTEWVLSMDADYIVDASLIEELNQLTPRPNIHGYQIAFSYLIRGKPLRGSLYPPRTCLYKKQFAHYVQDGHAHKVTIAGDVDRLQNKLLHDDRKPFSRWLGSQKKYAQQEAVKLKSEPWSQLSIQDKLRVLGLAPLAVLPFSLFYKALILDGLAGLEYTAQRFIAELYLQKARIQNMLSDRG